jgi:eukaryotic-like serine/threonine-protein kinase
LHQPAVLDELRLTDEQRPQVKAFCARVGKEWEESLGDVGRLSHAERVRRAVERARAYESEVNLLLTPEQRARLRQIGLQAEGPGAFNEPEVVAELELTAEQRDQIRTIEDETLFGWMKGVRPAAPGESGPRDRPANERILAVLTDEQVQRWRTMTGEPVNFPIAPFGSPDARTQP